ncbi:MAG: hypothetical protein IT234_01530 [Bacteroidia bacterium]|nr:hypothetical protein [Bacteroidia bacterium]
MKKEIDNIYYNFVELSDVDLQKKLWLNEQNNSNQISSFTELYCRLFDDNDFDGFIISAKLNNVFSKNLLEQIIHLREMLNNYNEKETDREIINDPEWSKIVTHAKLVIENWNKEK